MPKHYRSCHLCEAMCGLEIETEGERVVAIRGDKRDPWSQGFICPKGVALQDIHHDPDRLRQPMKRTADGWQAISWEEALDTTAREIVRVQKTYGDDALGLYWGNPPTHSHGILLTMLPFFMSLKTRNRYSAASIDTLPHYMSSFFMFGNQVLFPVADIDRTDFWLILGGNPIVSNGSISSAPNMRGRIKDILGRGGRVVVVDPRRTETAEVAGEHLAIRPGSDILLLLALLHTIFAEQNIYLHHLADFTDGLEAIEQLVQPYPPERVAEWVGLPAGTITQLAHDFSTAKTAVAYGRLGTCLNPFGTVCQWLINVLNIVTGNFDRPGGAMFTTPALDLTFIAKLITGGGHYNQWQSRVQGLPEFADELPVSALADEILTPGEGQIKAMLLIAGNPVLSTPDGNRLDKAMAQLDFCVALDFYINETNRHAHIILPPISPLEHSNYEAAVSSVAVRNIARYSPAVFEKPAGGMADWEIIVSLMGRVERLRGGLSRFVAPLKQAIFDTLTPDGILALGLRIGHQPITLKQLKATPHTVDFGPLEPRLPQILYTRDKRVQLAPELFVQDIKRVESYFLRQKQPSLPNQLLLIGRRHLRSNNSWMHNSERLVKGRPRCTLLMHPADAEARDIRPGQTVCVKSTIGELAIPVEITEAIRPGVVSMPHGWGHTRPGTQWHIAQQHAGVSLNDITDARLMDELSGTSVVNGIPVQVLKWDSMT